MIDLSSPFDITSWRLRGTELTAEIAKQIKGLSETILSVPLPSKILMTQDQYDDLMTQGNMENMYHSEDKMYITPHNIMEVRVDKRKKLTFTEANSLDDKAFEEWEKSIGVTNET